MTSDETVEHLKRLQGELLTIIKAVDNSSRLKTLISLMSTPRAFQNIKEITGLEKSTLSIHLNTLIKASLVEKYQHGVYRITETGLELLESLLNVYLNQVKREANAQQASMKREMTETFLHRGRRKL